jgi:crossover junction endodeoxyribonuclease RusA
VSSVAFTLPYPPSVNRYWRSVRGRNILSKEAREYKAVAHAAILANGWRVTGPVAVAFTLYPPDNRLRDGDNVGKPLFDALVAGGAIDGDDNRVVKSHSVTWATVDKANPRVEVTIMGAVDKSEKQA